MVFHAVHNASPLLLPTLFTALLQFAISPSYWKTAKVVLVRKPVKTYYDLPKAYSSFCHQPCLTTIMEKIVATRLTNTASLRWAIYDEDFCFLPLELLMTIFRHCSPWPRPGSAQ